MESLCASCVWQSPTNRQLPQRIFDPRLRQRRHDGISSWKRMGIPVLKSDLNVCINN